MITAIIHFHLVHHTFNNLGTTGPNVLMVIEPVGSVIRMALTLGRIYVGSQNLQLKSKDF